MAKYNFADMCDVPWWEELKTDKEKDEFCKENFGISYAEYLEELEHPSVKYDPETKQFVAI